MVTPRFKIILGDTWKKDTEPDAKGKWNLFDQIVFTGIYWHWSQYTEIYKHEIFSAVKKKKGNTKVISKRTQAGGVWQMGIAIALPTIIYLIKEMTKKHYLDYSSCS